MATTDSASGSTKKQYYDNDYFDTDEEPSDNENSMAVDDTGKKDRRKGREIQSNDDLLYDPEDDDANEDWVGEQLRAIAPSKNGTPSKQMAKTDAILTCPLCFTPVCLSCQRHELYPNQYRAMFVTNCRPNFAERFRYRESNNANNIPEEAKGSDVYYPVNCDICKTHIAMFDDEEVYHFFNGLQKAVSRLPHQILSKKGDVTRDPEYAALERQFKDVSKIVERFQTEAEAYRDGVAAMLNHQASFSEYLAILYQPLEAETEDGVVKRRNNETSAKDIQAVQDYATIMGYSRDEIMPWLDVIDAQVIGRVIEFREVLKGVDRTITKRNHKQLDYDRFRTSVVKLKAKAEKTISEEKQVYKLEGQLDIATQDYEYLNGLLKEELPRLLQLRTQLIDPMFENFYFIQCRIYSMLLARLQEVISTNGDHFQTINMGIDEGFNERLNRYNARTELEESGLLKQGGRAWLGGKFNEHITSAANSSRLTLRERAAIRQEEKTKGSPQLGGGGYGSSGYASDSPPPPAYGINQDSKLDSSTYQGDTKHSPSYGGYNNTYSPPSGHSPQASASGQTTYVTALYDYAAQAEGDLTFSKGDRIQVVEKTQDVNDWWTGSLNGHTGVFPGNYVTEE